MRGEYGRALRYLEGASTSGRSPAEKQNLHGLALLLEGKASDALEDFNQAIELQPALVEARFNRAVALIQLGHYLEASADLSKIYANEASPLRASAAYHNALALKLAGKYAEAEQWTARTLALQPQHDAATLLRGMLLERRRDFQAAGKAYRDFLGRHPDSVVGILRFGVVAQGAGYTDVAKKYLQRVIELAPDSPEAVEARKFLVMWD